MRPVIVCGGRDYGNATSICQNLERLFLEFGDSLVVVTGGATGADFIANTWARHRNVRRAVVRPDWSKGRKAGPLRNAEMLRRFKPVLVVAFPGGKGTADMVRQAQAAGVPVREIDAK